MEIGIGRIQVSKNQKKNLSKLHSDAVLGITVQGDGYCIIQTSRDLTADEIAKIKTDLAALPETPQPEEQAKIDFQNHPLRTMTLAQLEDHIEQNVTSIPSAKSYLKQLTQLVFYLMNR